MTADYRYAKDTPAEDSQTFLKTRFNCYFWREIVIKQSKSNLWYLETKSDDQMSSIFFIFTCKKKKTLGTQRLNMGLLGESLSLKPLRNGNLPQYLGSKISWKKGITYSAFYQHVSIGKKKTRKIFQGKKVETIISFVSFRWWMEVTENVYLCKGHIGYRPYIHVYVEYLKFLSLIPFKKSWTNK